MATTTPYAAPFARARRTPRIDSRIVRYCLICVGGVLVIALTQLFLASDATATIYAVQAAERDVSLLQGELDLLRSQAEELSSPTRVEREAIRLGLKPITNIEYLR